MREEPLTNSGTEVRLWDATTGKPIGDPMRHQDRVSVIAFSPDGKTVLTGSDDKTARLWNAANGRPTGASMRHNGRVVAIAFAADGKTVLTGSDDKTAQLWDATTGKPIGFPMRHEDRLCGIAFRSDGKAVLTGTEKEICRRWKVPTPLRGNWERIALWVEVITGLELKKSGAVRTLDTKTWLRRHERLGKLGGAP